jgi:hypothetical protein
MHEGHHVFAQLMQHLPLTTFRRCVARYDGERKIKRFSCLDQYLCLAFAQLTWRESLRDIEACLRAQSSKLYHLGFRAAIARNTLANANAVRDWRIYADFAQHLIAIARRLYADDPLAIELDDTVYALDSTTIDLCLSVFPWAPFRSTKAAVKLHTLLDLRGNIPSFIFISDGKMHDVNILDRLVLEAGAFYVMDRGYVDFERLARLDDAGSFFVTRAKSNLKARRRYSRPVDRSSGLVCDQTVLLTGFYSRQGFNVRCGGSNTTIRKPASGWCSSPTILPRTPSPSPSSTNAAGRWSCSSNGSNNICASRHSSARPRTPSNPKSGSPSRSTSSSPSSKNASRSRPASTKSYKS